jgi:hypothetical protein
VINARVYLQSLKLDSSSLEHALLFKVVIPFKPVDEPLDLGSLRNGIADGKDKAFESSGTARVNASLVIATGIVEETPFGNVSSVTNFNQFVQETFSDASAFVVRFDINF